MALTVAVAASAALLAASAWIPWLRPRVFFIPKAFYFFMEFLFWFGTTSNTQNTVLAIAVVAACVALGRRRRRGEGGVAEKAFWILAAFLALIAQAYIVAFAALAWLPLFAGYLAVAAWVFRFVARAPHRLGAPGGEPEAPALSRHRANFADIPTTHVLLFVGAQLFLAMVTGRFGVPIVQAVSEIAARGSADAPAVYRLAALFVLAVPALPLWRSIRGERGRAPVRARAAVVAAACVVVMTLAVPAAWAMPFAGAAIVAVVAAGLARAGFAPIDWLSFDPRRAFAALLPLSLVAFVAFGVHYAARMWDCADRAAPGLGVVRLTRDAGAFDFATTADGDTLIAALRESRRVIAVPTGGGTARTILDTRPFTKGTGAIFSGVEPETILRVGDDRFLLLLAVSDNHDDNDLLVLRADGTSEGLVERLSGTGISEMVRGPGTRVYVSMEFDNGVFVLSADDLTLLDTIRWPQPGGEATGWLAGEGILSCGVEPNKILVDDSGETIYSLGLWCDPMLRALDVENRRESARVFVGTRSWDMAMDGVRRRIYVPKFISGRMLVVDTNRMEIAEEWPVGFGIRPVAVDPSRGRVYTASMYSGEVFGIDAETGERVFRRRIGGHIKGLHLDEATGALYTGCDCGVFRIDPHIGDTGS
ncbi:YncE family protein [bacterium]|nr:YncE family protein [bacterium]